MKRMLFYALTAVALSVSGASAPALAAGDQPELGPSASSTGWPTGRR